MWAAAGALVGAPAEGTVVGVVQRRGVAHLATGELVWLVGAAVGEVGRGTAIWSDLSQVAGIVVVVAGLLATNVDAGQAALVVVVAVVDRAAEVGVRFRQLDEVLGLAAALAATIVVGVGGLTAAGVAGAGLADELAGVRVKAAPARDRRRRRALDRRLRPVESSIAAVHRARGDLRRAGRGVALALVTGSVGPGAGSQRVSTVVGLTCRRRRRRLVGGRVEGVAPAVVHIGDRV